MALYEYEAKNLKGNILKGTVDAADEAAVVDILRQRNFYPTSIRLYKESLNIEIDLLNRVKLKDIAIFCRQFSFILTAGINILRALEIVKEQTDNKRLKNVLEKVYEDVQRGQTLSEAMKNHKEFPTMLISMVEVGETSGTLDNVMIRMAAYYDKEHKQRQKIKQALTYPAVVSIFAFTVVLVLVVKVLPTFTAMFAQFPGAELPAPTKIIMGVSNFIIEKWWLLIIIIMALAAAFSYYVKTEEGAYLFDKIKIKIPIFGKLYTKVIVSRFARTFGMLMGSGVPLMVSTDICSEVVGNKVYSKVLKELRGELEKGLSVGQVLEEKKLFPAMITQMIKIGEESGTLDSILDKTADYYDSEVETATAQLTSMIEPVIVIILAVVVGFIVVSIILPIFEMYNAMGSQ